MSIKSPNATNIHFETIAANFAHLTWDSAGGVFTYSIERKDVDIGSWVYVADTNDSKVFDKALLPETTYQYRVKVNHNSLESSEWEYSDIFTTFKDNAYSIQNMANVSYYDEFLTRKLMNNEDYINFNEADIAITLVNESFFFRAEDTNISDIQPWLLERIEHIINYDKIDYYCSSPENILPFVWNDNLYYTERYQGVVYKSTDGGNTWSHIVIKNGRVGDPVDIQAAVATENYVYLLGYDGIFGYSDVFQTGKWSSDDIKFSSDIFKFTEYTPDTKLNFTKATDYPVGIPNGAVTSICLGGNDDLIYVGYGDEVWEWNISTGDWNPTYGQVTGNSNAKIKNLIWYNNTLFAYVYGDDDSIIPESGVYRKSQVSMTAWTRIYGEEPKEFNLILGKHGSLSRNANYLVFTSDNEKLSIFTDHTFPITNPIRIDKGVSIGKEFDFLTTIQRQHRQPLSSTGNEFTSEREDWHYESDYFWIQGNRVNLTTDNRMSVIWPLSTNDKIIENTSEDFEYGIYRFWGDSIHFNEFEGTSYGAVYYEKSTGNLIGAYKTDVRRGESLISWLPDRLLLAAVLTGGAIDATEEEPDVPPSFTPPLEPYKTTLLPNHFFQRESLYTDFVDAYLEYISSDEKSDYGLINNLIRHKDPLETPYYNLITQEINKRNKWITPKKWDELTRFFNSRDKDFYSIKGTLDSYKFLFKFLYNEDIEAYTYDTKKYTFTLVIETDDITSDIIGTRLLTDDETGQATVIEYNLIPFEQRIGEVSILDALPQWEVVVGEVWGKFTESDTVKAEYDEDFTGTVIQGVTGKANPLQLNTDKTFYTIVVSSGMTLNEYKDDVYRFVHPVGFNLIGLAMLIMTIKTDLTPKHISTIIERYLSPSWDMGLPLYYPDYVYQLDFNGEYVRDDDNELIPIVPTVEKYGYVAGDDYPVPGNYDTDNPEIIDGNTATERRKYFSRTFDTSWYRFSDLFSLILERLDDSNQKKYGPSPTILPQLEYTTITIEGGGAVSAAGRFGVNRVISIDGGGDITQEFEIKINSSLMMLVDFNLIEAPYSPPDNLLVSIDRTEPYYVPPHILAEPDDTPDRFVKIDGNGEINLVVDTFIEGEILVDFVLGDELPYSSTDPETTDFIMGDDLYTPPYERGELLPPTRFVKIDGNGDIAVTVERPEPAIENSVDFNMGTIHYVSPQATTDTYPTFDMTDQEYNPVNLNKLSVYSATMSLNPAAYWRMNEASGNLIDSVNSADLLQVGSPTYKSGPIGRSYNGIYFNGSPDRFYLRDQSQLYSPNFTLSLFLRLDSSWVKSGTQCIFAHGNPAYVERGWSLFVASASDVLAFSYFDSNWRQLNGSTILTTDTDYHVVLVVEGNDVKIYLNNVLDASGTMEHNILSINQPTICVAHRETTSNNPELYLPDATISDISYYNYALSESQINLIYTGI